MTKSGLVSRLTTDEPRLQPKSLMQRKKITSAGFSDPLFCAGDRRSAEVSRQCRSGGRAVDPMLDVAEVGPCALAVMPAEQPVAQVGLRPLQPPTRSWIKRANSPGCWRGSSDLRASARLRGVVLHIAAGPRDGQVTCALRSSDVLWLKLLASRAVCGGLRPGRRKYVPVGSARDVLSRDGPAEAPRTPLSRQTPGFATCSLRSLRRHRCWGREWVRLAGVRCAGRRAARTRRASLQGRTCGVPADLTPASRTLPQPADRLPTAKPRADTNRINPARGTCTRSARLRRSA